MIQCDGMTHGLKNNRHYYNDNINEYNVILVPMIICLNKPNPTLRIANRLYYYIISSLHLYSATKIMNTFSYIILVIFKGT